MLVVSFLCVGFSQNLLAKENNILRLGGSTTLLPIISQCASDFQEKFETWDKVDPSLPGKDIVIFVTGGGSGFGVKSTINGIVDIGMASRKIKDKEIKLLGKYRKYLVGKDAVVIAANKKNPIFSFKNEFKSEELVPIFSGAMDTYKKISPSLPDKPVVLFVRDSGAGSAEMFQKLVMKKALVSPKAIQVPSQGVLLKRLEKNVNSIGYISSGLAFSSDKLSVFFLNGIRPSNEKVITGEYFFTRPLLLIVKDENLTPMISHFIKYVLTEGQQLVAENNYVPVNN